MNSNITHKKKGIARLLELSGQRKTELIAAIVFGVIHGILSLAPFILIYRFFDELFRQSFSYDAVVSTLIDDCGVGQLWLSSPVGHSGASCRLSYPVWASQKDGTKGRQVTVRVFE
jgi:ABC-type multidrug transport system fused ATPase/permease subunit